MLRGFLFGELLQEGLKVRYLSSCQEELLEAFHLLDVFKGGP